jgi:hypothetical protein
MPHELACRRITFSPNHARGTWVPALMRPGARTRSPSHRSSYQHQIDARMPGGRPPTILDQACSAARPSEPGAARNVQRSLRLLSRRALFHCLRGAPGLGIRRSTADCSVARCRFTRHLRRFPLGVQASTRLGNECDRGAQRRVHSHRGRRLVRAVACGRLRLAGTHIPPPRDHF